VLLTVECGIRVGCCRAGTIYVGVKVLYSRLRLRFMGGMSQKQWRRVSMEDVQIGVNTNQIGSDQSLKGAELIPEPAEFKCFKCTIFGNLWFMQKIVFGIV
jgi:hypothetical protein